MTESGFFTKSELVYRSMRRDLLRGRWSPGDRIVVDQVASELRVSKVPVREAVTRLIGEEWLTSQPHVGPTVPELSASEVEETALVRGVLEAEAAVQALRCIDSDLLSALEEAYKAMDAAVSGSDQDLGAFPELNREFHGLVISACPVLLLSAMAGQLMDRSLRYRTVFRLPGYLVLTQAEHRGILEALRSGNEASTRHLVHDHITQAGETLGRTLREKESGGVQRPAR
jgi:DNA-binding GntR family transcriptional regulator